MQSESQSLQHWSIEHEEGKNIYNALSYADTHALIKIPLTVFEPLLTN